MDKTLYLVRGLPGSGKTTFGRTLTDRHLHFEADNYFTHPVTGEYKFDASLLSIAHAQCRQHTMLAMQDSMTPIVVSNTFSRRWEMEEYYKLALLYGYKVVEITMSGNLHPSVHNVPQETIELMRNRWEN